MHYPHENEIREVKDLSGIWRFRADLRGTGQDGVVIDEAPASFVASLFDVVCVNECHGWYLETGRLEQIGECLLRERWMTAAGKS
jgi:hypothetical protein